MVNCSSNDDFEHYYLDSERIFLTLILGVIVIPVAVVMNSLMIISFIKYRRLRISGMYIIMNLAVSNLIATTISAPIMISNIIQKNPGCGVLDVGFFCDLRGLLDATLLCVSAITLAVSSVDRCWAVWRPFSYHKFVTTKRTLWVIAGIWITCLIVCMPPVKFSTNYKSWGRYSYSRFSYSCAIQIKSDYPLVFFIFTLFIPVAIAYVSYSIILSVAIKSINHMGRIYTNVNQNPDLKRTKRTLKSSLRTLALVGIFAVTMLPTLAIALVVWVENNTKTSGKTLKLSMNVAKVLHWLTYAGYALNPIVYGLMDKNFRRAYKTFFKCELSTDTFRRRAQRQLYEDLMEDRRRSTGLSSCSHRRNRPSFYNSSENGELTQMFALSDLRSLNGSTPKSTMNRSIHKTSRQEQTDSSVESVDESGPLTQNGTVPSTINSDKV